MICSRDKIKQKNKIERGEDIARNTTHQLCLKWVFREDRCKGGRNEESQSKRRWADNQN